MFYVTSKMHFARFRGHFRYGLNDFCPFLSTFSLWAKGVMPVFKVIFVIS